MRVRELHFHDFRSFRGENTISFVDPMTDAPRPVTVLAGTNGSGKTTVFEAIEALLAFVVDPENPRDLVLEAFDSGLVRLVLEIEFSDMASSLTVPYESSGHVVGNFGTKLPWTVAIAVGNKKYAPTRPDEQWHSLWCTLVQKEKAAGPLYPTQ